MALTQSFIFAQGSNLVGKAMKFGEFELDTTWIIAIILVVLIIVAVVVILCCFCGTDGDKPESEMGNETEKMSEEMQNNDEMEPMVQKDDENKMDGDMMAE